MAEVPEQSKPARVVKEVVSRKRKVKAEAVPEEPTEEVNGETQEEMEVFEEVEPSETVEDAPEDGPDETKEDETIPQD
nr:hypothetical protein [Thermoplasmata archaeon]NIS13108.1 hypothetical protein [Thermoplasmata archaeon]NIS20468.1 hypothetical protein [Thermoplasmata archaeon]NIT78465.1 hypothetical protein [Thermoplasmata archaeon]NIV79753.1 hypothetical protein [Thermoplasmata archaeon]